MRDYLLVALVGAIIGLAGWAINWAVVSALDQPQVFTSYQTKKCVRVEDPAAEREGRKPYTCDDLPEQFEVVWVR